MLNDRRKNINPSALVEYLNDMAKKEGISFSEAVRRAMSSEDLQATLAAIQQGKSQAA